jgi:hypothetical protein
MGKIIIYLFLLLLPFQSHSQSIISSSGFYGTGGLQVFKSAIDAQNNIYLIGYFTNKVTFNGNTYDANGSGQEIFVAKINSNGDFSWFRRVGSSGNDYATGIKLNGSSLFLTGYYPGELCTFGDNITLNNSAPGTSDAFLLELNTDNGNINNVIRIAYGNGGQIPTDITIDHNSNIVISGYVVGNGNTSFFIGGSHTITCNGPVNYFLLQLNTTFAINWLKHYTADDGNNNLYSIDVDETGYYIAGMNRGTLNLDISSLTSQGSAQDMFLYKTNFEGQGQWLRSIKGSAKDVSQFATSDKKGNIYISGYYASNDLTVDSTATLKSNRTVPYNNSNDIFYAKYNSVGTLQWFNVAGSAGDDKLTRLNAHDKYFIIAGQFGGDISYNNEILSPKGGVDALGMVHDDQDNLLYAISAGGTGTDAAQTCLIDNHGNYILIGEFNSPKIYFSPDNTLSITSPNTSGVFIAKYKSRSISIISSPILCAGTNTGSITANPKGAWVGTKSYLWSKTGDPSFTATTATIENIGAGTYTCRITDDLNAETESITISDPTPLTVSEKIASHLNATCYDASNGRLEAEVTGGAGTISYLWSGNGTGIIATIAVQNTLSAGSYMVTVTDDNGCSASVNSMVITQPQKIVFKNTTVTPINGSLGEVNLSVQGGTPAYTYSWSGPSGYTATTEDIDLLTSAGNYTVTVTDQNSCNSDTTVLIIDSNNLYAYISDKKEVGCFGGTDGSITITPETNDLNPDFSYEWTGPDGYTATTAAISGLKAGTYSVTVTDATPDPDKTYTITDIVITQPAAVLSVTTTPGNPLCAGGSTGFVDADAAGGTLPYTYSWKKNGTDLTENTEVISQLSHGNYEVTVTDANSCPATTTATLTNPSAISVNSAIVTPVTCIGTKNDGSIALNVSGGTGTLNYRWSNGLTSPNISLLSPGTYICTITDANKCFTTTTQTVGQPAAITAGFSNANVSCFGGTNGSIDLTPAGGNNGTYTYAWSSGAVSEDLSGITAGNYSVTITDSKNCEKLFTTSITEPTELNISQTALQNVNCNGLTNGSISVSASGGTSPYLWSWSNSQTGPVASNLAAGSYTVTAIDNKNCTKDAVFVITEPTVLQISEVVASHTDVLCNGASTGSLEVSASGSSGTYEFSMDGTNWQSSGEFNNIAAGSYTVMVRDQSVASCTQSISPAIAVNQPAAITISSPVVTNITCAGLSNGSIAATASGGTGTFTYKLKLGGAETSNITGASNGTFTGLAAGTTYTMEAADANSCSVASSQTSIAEPQAVTLTSVTATGITCNGTANGAINAQASGGTGAYAYTLLVADVPSANTTGASSGNFTGLASGTSYKVEVTDANSCTPAISAITAITEPASITVTSITATDITCSGSTNGAIQVQASGGTGALSYKLLLSSTPVSNTTGTVSGIFSDVAAGAGYTVEVTDANNCVPAVSATVTILEPAQVSITAELATKTTAVGSSDGSINITATGGTGALSYKLNNGTPQATGLFSGLPRGTYQVSITDANSCGPVQSSSLIIDEPTSISIIRNGTIKAYPNPATDRVSIEVNDQDIKNLTVQLKNITGQAAITEKFENITPGYIATLDLYQLPKGIYVIIVNNRVLKDKLIIH